jgi:hypothetical protein
MRAPTPLDTFDTAVRDEDEGIAPAASLLLLLLLLLPLPNLLRVRNTVFLQRGSRQQPLPRVASIH